MKAYTKIREPWMNTLAFAMLWHRGHGDVPAEGALMERLHVTTDAIGVPLEYGVADVTLAIARLLEGIFPSGMAQLEFRDMETGEVAEPDVFLTTPDGQASVWAARFCAAALGLDRPMVESMVDHQLGLGAMPLLEGFRQLLLGAANIHHEGVHREQHAAYAAMEATGTPPEYVLRCFAIGPFGGGPRRCIDYTTGSRHLRDAKAARHVLETGHTITMKEE